MSNVHTIKSAAVALLAALPAVCMADMPSERGLSNMTTDMHAANVIGKCTACHQEFHPLMEPLVVTPEEQAQKDKERGRAARNGKDKKAEVEEELQSRFERLMEGWEKDKTLLTFSGLSKVEVYKRSKGKMQKIYVVPFGIRMGFQSPAEAYFLLPSTKKGVTNPHTFN